MVGILGVLFLVVPLIEIYVLLKVGQTIGVLETIGVLVLVSVVGAWLVKREGLSTFRRAQASVRAGRVPGREILDGVLLLLAGALLLTPGFFTDLIGLSLLLPPVRAALRRAALPAVLHRFTGRPRRFRR